MAQDEEKAVEATESGQGRTTTGDSDETTNAHKAGGSDEKQASGSLKPLARLPWRRHVTSSDQLLRHHYKGSGTDADPYLVTWLPEDPENPMTFAEPYKWTVTMLVAIATLAVALASSAFSGTIEPLMADLGGSDEVLTLGVSMFVLGFALGPLIWAPLSEILGRRLLFIGTYTMFTLWQAVAVASPNVGALIVFRFFAGAFGSSPLTNSGGTISDIFEARTRGLALAVFASMPFLGPSLGPMIGGFIGIAGGWQWVLGFLALFSAALTTIGFLFLPETYTPVLLRQRAARLSQATGQHYKSHMEAKGSPPLTQLFKTALTRPWMLLFTEPIVFLLSLYMAIVYGTLYMLFSAFPIVFQQGRGWNAGVGGLAFLGVMVGMLTGVAYVIVYDNPRYIKTMERHAGIAPPEARLPPAMVGAFLLVIGLAWFAATDGPNIHWFPSVAAGAPFGMGMVLVFLSTMNYLIDAYLIYAASVLAANSVLRSLFGCVFPLFTTYMFQNLGIHWAVAVPGFLALLCLPFPFLFYKYGPAIRVKCKFAGEADRILQQMRKNDDDDSTDEGTSSSPSHSPTRRSSAAPSEEREGPAELRTVTSGRPKVKRNSSLSSRTSSLSLQTTHPH